MSHLYLVRGFSLLSSSSAKGGLQKTVLSMNCSIYKGRVLQTQEEEVFAASTFSHGQSSEALPAAISVALLGTSTSAILVTLLERNGGVGRIL